MRVWWVLGVCLAAGLLAGSASGAAKFKPGDMAVVKTDNAPVKQGSDVIGTLPKGTRIKVNYVHEEGGFALVYITVGGKARKGYVQLKDLEPPTRKEGPKVKGSGYRADDRVVVKAKRAKLMKGKAVLGRVAEGTVLTVVKVRGDWVGVKPEIEGKRTFGWIHSRDIDYAPFEGGDLPEEGKDKEKDKDKGKK